MKHQIQSFWKIAVKGDLHMIASALSFTTLLSIIPFLAVSLATLKYFDGLETLYPTTLLFWVLLIWYIVLTGAALTASLQPEKRLS
jgi:uncharacterized BrkB/YihY/UPF0761 family membrane protein